jgi:hypothetical protein
MKIPKTIKVFGDLNYRNSNCNHEWVEQKEFFGWMKEHLPLFFEIAIHPKNEGKRIGKQSVQDKELGSLNAGASDIIIPCSVPFVCELKKSDHTKSILSSKQLQYLERCKDQGAFACIALGNNGAKIAIDEWLLFCRNLNK